MSAYDEIPRYEHEPEPFDASTFSAEQLAAAAELASDYADYARSARHPMTWVAWLGDEIECDSELIEAAGDAVYAEPACAALFAAADDDGGPF